MNPERRIARLLQRAAHDADVLAVMLYGSAARRDASATSDVDVCLVLTPERRTAAQMSAKRLQYLQEVDLDVQVFQQLPLYIRQRVLKDGRVVEDSNPGAPLAGSHAAQGEPWPSAR